jgi:hypothetical protein
MTADQFSSTYGVDLSKDISSNATFDITSQVLTNNNFDPNFDGSNYHGFVCVAKGATESENGTIPGDQLFSKLGNPNSTSSAQTGDVAVWSTKGSVDGVNLTRQPAHSAIYVITNQAGEQQFLNRIGTNASVTINTNEQIS